MYKPLFEDKIYRKLHLDLSTERRCNVWYKNMNEGKIGEMQGISFLEHMISVFCFLLRLLSALTWFLVHLPAKHLTF